MLSDSQTSEIDELLRRSQRLGADLKVTNFAGGNTSAKTRWVDPIDGRVTTSMWIKGSGGDLATLDRAGLAQVDVTKLQALEKHYHGISREDEMVDFLAYCLLPESSATPSIDTPLHGLLPYAHVDHVHPDAVIALAACANGEAITANIFDNRLGWLPWQRPGFDLGLKLKALATSNPALEGCVLGGHGLIVWADSSHLCYERTLEFIKTANDHIEAQVGTPFGGQSIMPIPSAARQRTAAKLMVKLRRELTTNEHKVGHFDAQPAVLEFVNSADCERLADLGTSCPDHFLTTKLRPLVIDLETDIGQAVTTYQQRYAMYYQRLSSSDSPPMRGNDPVVVVMLGIGICAFAQTKEIARIACEFYVNAINVMKGAELIDRYQPINEAEAFRIEYWQLEEAKLSRRPRPKSLCGRIAVVTGGAGGIGQAIAEQFLQEDACVVLLDIDQQGLINATERLKQRYSADRVHAIEVDVTNYNQVTQAFLEIHSQYGGLDILVANAGIASSSAVSELTVEEWDRNFTVLGRGYFLAAQAALRTMQQGRGGNIVFIGSKNALAASKGAAAYCSVKAAELHLARCLALEGAEWNVRVNVVNPDAVLSGSKIWSSQWRRERAAAYNIEESELEEFYIGRSLLKQAVLPTDVAEAVLFLASDRASKSTGNIINVDAGNPTAFPR